MKCNQRVAITKRLLKEALVRLLEKKNIDKISITELCNDAGINRATFYRHYNIPRDVLSEIESDLTAEFYRRCDPIERSKDTYNYILNICTYLYEKFDVIEMLITNKSEQDFTHMVNDLFFRFLNNKDKYPNLANVDDDNVRLITSFIAGGGYFMIRHWLMDDVSKSPEEIAKLLVNFLDYSSLFHTKE